MADKEKKKGELDNLIEGDIKSIDPTKIGGIDGSSSSIPNLDEEVLNWTKSRGKKK